MDNLIKNLNKFKKRRIFSVLVILAAVPVVVILVQVSQEIRERAAGGPSTLIILPTSQTKSIGDSGTVVVYLDPGGANVSSVELVIDYDPSVIEVTDIKPGSFFTSPSSQIGDPIIIVKNLETPGRIHYALGFPLGSGHSSTATDDAAVFDFKVIDGGLTPISLVASGQPKTIISDLNAQDVLGQVVDGSIEVSTADARLYFSEPVPPNPQTVGSTFTLEVLAATGGQQVDAIDARIKFDPTFLEVISVDEGSETELISYPALDFDNTAGTAIISANVGGGSSSIPINGTNLHIGTITFGSKKVSPGTQVDFEFTQGERNDSNMVISGTWQTQDPIDILSSTTGANIEIESGPTLTITPTPSPSPTPILSPTPTPTGLPVVNFNNYSITSFASGQDFNPTMNILDGGITLQLIGNGWKKIPFPFTMTANTILEFDYKSDTEGEVQGIAIEEDNIQSANRVFKVHGTQIWGITTYDNYVNGSGWKSYSIPVGQHYTGNMNYLVFANDHDFGSQDGESLFRNVRVCETTCSLDPSATPTPVPTLTTSPTTTPTVSPSSTVTPEPPQSLTIKLGFEGRLRSGVSKRKIIGLFYKKVGETAVGTAIFTTNENGEGTVDLAPGSYILLFDADGYLARRFGSDASPIVIPEGNIILDLTASPLLGGDFNDDGEVNEVDYTNFFLPSFLGSTEYIDLDGSGEINNLDFAIMRANWNLIDDSL